MENIIKLPDFKFEEVVSTLSENADWGVLQGKIPEVWSITEGENIVVFLLDTGATTVHEDLVDNFIGGKNLTSSRTDEDLVGHSHFCFGCLAASKNDTGVIGVAPKTKVFLIKVLDDRGRGKEDWISEGLKFCYECAIGKEGFPRPDIISMSLGAKNPLEKAYFWIKKLHEINIPLVCAAGNSGRSGTRGLDYPAVYKETIAIGAFDENGNIPDFSSFGEDIDFVAPGVSIYSTIPKNSYAINSGTSFSCPFFTGIIALLLSKHKKQELKTGKNDCKTIEEIINHLKKYSIDHGPLGFDDKYGYGIVDVRKLIHSDNDEETTVKV